MNIVLGTAQLGLNYGISNTDGRTTLVQAKKILDLAWNSGIKSLDTANAYGDSEYVIGKLSNDYDWNLITKTPHFTKSVIDNSALEYFDKKLKLSIELLGVDKIDTLLIHSVEDLFKPNGDLLYKKLVYFKKCGLLRKIGASVYDYKQIDSIIDNYDIDVIQLPFSILDQRLLISKHLEKIKKNNIEIHARSVFLQGLLLMNPNDIPLYFLDIFDNIQMFLNYSKEKSLTNVELALSYVNSIREIDKIVVGVNKVEQLSEIICANKIKINTEECLNISVKDERFVNPVNWEL